MTPKGTKIRITDTRDVWRTGLYKNGDELITSWSERAESWTGAMVQFAVQDDFGDGPGLLYIMHKEFEVVE